MESVRIRTHLMSNPVHPKDNAVQAGRSNFRPLSPAKPAKQL